MDLCVFLKSLVGCETKYSLFGIEEKIFLLHLDELNWLGTGFASKTTPAVLSTFASFMCNLLNFSHTIHMM